jgi:hypothetical protein
LFLEEFVDFFYTQILEFWNPHRIGRQLKATLLGYHSIHHNISRNIPSFALSRSPTRDVD